MSHSTQSLSPPFLRLLWQWSDSELQFKIGQSARLKSNLWLSYILEFGVHNPNQIPISNSVQLKLTLDLIVVNKVRTLADSN